ncbi:MAG: serine protease [Treponema sp.]|nr:serine protease [Treponema sp.]MCL2236841.1 serine protease [Treponema sp.]
MNKKIISLFLLFLLVPLFVFAQTGAAALRDYVGLINQTYHPDIVSYFEKTKAEFIRQGETNAARIIDIILSGAFGSGFLYNDARGNFYIITNNHVVSQAHTLSVTFERADGTSRKIENLSIVATDVDTDLALLAFPAGERPPVNRGLMLATRAAQEGEDVFSAGFPGLGMTPIWQFSRGMVSNANVRFPKSIDDETMMGPYIQHTSQIDAGNSGGPLLVLQTNAPGGFAVVGINTLQGVNRQSANYAIPASKIQEFVNNSLNPRPATFRAALDARISQFLEGLSANKAIYPHIADFLSVACVGENAEWATQEMYRRAGQVVRREFTRKFYESVVDAMALAVAWTIENDIRPSTGSISASLKEVTGEGEQYTVVFTINNRDVESVWIREYGNWRIKTFGTIATGNAAERVVQTQAQRDRAARRASDPFGFQNKVHFEIGYATLFSNAPAAFYGSFGIAKWGGINFYYISDEYYSLGAYGNFTFPIPLEKIGLMPYFRIGLCSTIGIDTAEIAVFIQGGLRLSSASTEGVYCNFSFQYNIAASGLSLQIKNPFDSIFPIGLVLSAGYSF